MRTTDFNNTFKRLKQNDGKEYFEAYLQHCGWWFLQLTEKQCDKMVNLFKEWGYERKYNEYNGKTYICTPNGIQIIVNE